MNKGRFKSQALLDEAGLLTCMAYVDLNPIRAGITERPETSEFTAIYQRIRALATDKTPPRAKPKTGVSPAHAGAPTLLPLNPTPDAPKNTLPFALNDYLELVDWTGRTIRDGKRGHIPEALPNILTRLNIAPQHWLNHMQLQGNPFNRAIGRVEKIQAYAHQLGHHWLCGLGHSRRLFSAPAP